MNHFSAVFFTWSFAQGFGVSAPCSLSVLYLLFVKEHHNYLETLLLLPLSYMAKTVS